VRAKDIQTNMLHSLQGTPESCFKNTFHFELYKFAILTLFFLICMHFAFSFLRMFNLSLNYILELVNACRISRSHCNLENNS